MYKKLNLMFISTAALCASEYEFGYGVKMNEYMHLGGYVSTEFFSTSKTSTFTVDDMAILVYGYLQPKLSYFSEIEASGVYTRNFDSHDEGKNNKIHIERLYIDYSYSKRYNIRVGKQITPLGYWNYEPINVLRDTTSNPSYSYTMFPKLFTGIDLYGTVGEESTMHIFAQYNNDIDDKVLNITSKYFIGISLEYMLNNKGVGASLGKFKRKNDDNIIEFVQLNAKYLQDGFDLQTEFIYTINQTNAAVNNEFVGYVQGKYAFSEQHALVARYEYIDKQRLEHISILGYSYRPVEALSFKCEYQWTRNQTRDNFLLSLSVLF